MDFSKLDSGKMELQRISFSPREIAERVVNISSVTLADGVDIFLRIDPQTPTFVLGDPVKYVVLFVL